MVTNLEPAIGGCVLNRNHRIKNILHITVLLVLAVIFMFPLVVTVTNSFMSEQEIAHNYDPVTDKNLSSYNDDTASHFARFRLIPDVVVLKQYYNVLIKRPSFFSCSGIPC